MKTFLSDPKTSIAGVLAAIGQILPLFGIPGIPGWVCTAISTLGVLLIGHFAKDAAKQ